MSEDKIWCGIWVTLPYHGHFLAGLHTNECAHIYFKIKLFDCFRWVVILRESDYVMTLEYIRKCLKIYFIGI